jgi:multidrug efflux system membrane fusion protein
MKRFLFPFTVAWPAVLALVLAAGCKPASKVKPAKAGGAAVPVQVAVAVRQDVPRQVESIGAAQALRSVTVKSQIDGVIAAIHFREGDEVKAGDLLVTLDRRPFENSLRMAQAALANARAEGDQARADEARYQRLNQEDAISKEQYAQLVTKVETTQAQIQSAAAAVANAQLQLGYTEIRAPIDGRTGQLLLHEGALVKANDSASSLVTLNQIAPIAVAYAVPETELAAIRAAQADGDIAVSVKDRDTALNLTGGRLMFIDNTVDVSTGTITLKAVFPNESHLLWPGQFVHVTTQTGMDRAVIVVPSTAIMAGQKGATAYIMKPDRTVELRDVKIMRTDGDNTLVAAGIGAGDTVVTDGQLRLLPGVKVEPVTLGGLPAKD